jgi:hypothetical protein
VARGLNVGPDGLAGRDNLMIASLINSLKVLMEKIIASTKPPFAG